MDGAMLSLDWDDAAEGDASAPARAVEASLDRVPTPAAWDALAAHASEPNPFYEGWFLRTSFRHLGEAGTRLLTVWRGEKLLGLLPVAPRQGYARMPLRLLANWAHHHLFLGTPLVRRGDERAFWQAALSALDAPSDTDLIHFSNLVEDGPVLRALLDVAAAESRPAEVVHRETRALYTPAGDGATYYENTVRKKKRKELGRLQKRFAEFGVVQFRTLGPDEDVVPWAEAFLRLEKSGWKGREGSALGCRPKTRAFFADMLAAAHRRGLLDFVRLDLDGRPAAMLCTLVAGAGGEGFSYKIAYDEALARFSPGVLLQIANLDMPHRRGLRAVDSCAVEDHPMINGLWAERRTLVRVTLARARPLSRAVFRLARAAERGAERWRAKQAEKRQEPA